MQNNKNKLLSRVLGIFCALTMFVSALYVPVVFNASAANPLDVVEDEVTLFTFDDTLGSSNSDANKTEFQNTGVGFVGWGIYTDAAVDNSSNKVLVSTRTQTQTWATSGAIRLNKKVGNEYKTYNLAPNTTYIVTMDVRCVSSSVFTDDAKTPYECYVSLGYGAKFTTNDTNYCSTIGTSLVKIISTKAESGAYTVASQEGTQTFACGKEWQKFTYQFTTPADFKGADTALALYGTARTGFRAEIDNLSVTKLADTTGVIVLIDEYSGTTEIVKGEIGTEYTLPDVSDKAQQADHIFSGWFLDKERTQAVEKVAFAKTKTVVYTGWKAPVTLTFKNTLDNTETVLDGMAGEPFEYPADPVDSEGKKWFMGWYTTEGYTEEHTSGKFGFASATLYSFWKSEVPGINQDFENYTKNEYTVKTEASGNKTKSNNLYFALPMSKQSEVTASADSNYAVKFDWDAQMVSDKDDINAYNAAGRYYEFDNFIWLGNGLENNTRYTVTFKVKVEKVGSKLDFYMLSAGSDNAWANYVRYQSGYKTYEQSEEWQEVSFAFTTNYKSASATTMYLGVRMENNVDTVLYFDDIEIKAVVQPYESLVTVVTGINGQQDIDLVGRRGDTVTLPTLTHPQGAEFKGWYADASYKTPVETVIFGRNSTTIYARWGSAPITFKDYPYNTTPGNNFGKLLSVENSAGVGNGDDYALRWTLIGDMPSAYNNGELYYKRAGQRDHIATIGKVKSGSVYRVSFDYKSDSDCIDGYNIRLVTSIDSNIWGGSWNAQTPMLKVAADDNDWQKYTFIFTADIVGSGTTLYIEFTSSNATQKTYVNALVDNILVEELAGDIVYFHTGNDVILDDAIEAKAGEPLTLPKSFTETNSVIAGLYLDEALTVPFTSDVVPQGITHLYVKWKAIVEDYKKFKVDSGEFYSVLKGEGVGYNDDAALRWVLDGPKTYYMGDTLVTHASRGTQYDHITPIQNPIKDGAVYRVSYYYMATKDTNVDVTITPIVGGSNIWWSSVRKKFDGLATTIKKGGCEWTKAEFYISVNVLKSGTLVGDRLYLILNTVNNNITNYTDVRIDNVSIELVTAPYIFFEPNNSEPSTIVRGEVGDKITYPATPERVGYEFDGWYSDVDCTVPFTLTHLAADTAITAYAKWNLSDLAVYSYEKFSLVNGGNWFIGDAEVLDFAKAKSGKKAVLFDRTKEHNNGASFIAVAQGRDLFTIDPTKQYIVTVYYYVESAPSGSLNLSFVGAGLNNAWTGINAKTYVGASVGITASAAKQNIGQWMSKTFVLDTSIIKDSYKNYTQLFLVVKGADQWKVWFDDITIRTVPEGMSAVSVENGGCDSVPTSIVGKPGTSFASKLPENPEVEGMFFSGYFTKELDGTYTKLEREAMVFADAPFAIYARFLDYKVVESFDNGNYLSLVENYKNSYTLYDFDYEIYDGSLEGNSMNNVTSGNYSLHRKGNTMYFENAVILTLGNQIAASQKYTVSFKVKLGKHYHTDGAIKVVSGRSSRYAWTTTGDYYPVVSIKELLDGEWHEVSYTFNSVEAFACVQTPGYVELFMDDFTFSIADESVPLSTPIAFTEYVPVKRDEKGNIIEKDDTAVDITSIIDVSLYLDNNGSMLWIIIGIAGGVIILAAAAVVTIILVKKKKKAKA